MKNSDFFTPSRHFTHQTSLQAEKVKINLKKSFKPTSTTNEILSRLSSNNRIKSYEGQVSENKFVITRSTITEGEKGYMHLSPIAQGVIKENQSGSKIICKVENTKFVHVSTLSFFTFFVIATIFAIIFILIPLDKKLIGVTIISGITALFLFLVYYFTSKYRTKKLEKEIIEIIEGKNK
ncbi:hypothetical protein Fleli_1336 [Bernardetia litoralis DSM 6794]|uniref:Uncharacterized protein n=1 Tax=Bernardetia litoralis (strain ATCC 23117 / DSM 6794 / NBRC 15988 / NCIMB 1366 / Fx l1 / Sio-4) TaxID=880071 RepID=I4AII3_BERLS|nr:hypothetical protein [Bernardetia litoralis]AFM03768.1 hypothetical protein Fleli_1336 [Bernardetia litoralis DSM 6794]